MRVAKYHSYRSWHSYSWGDNTSTCCNELSQHDAVRLLNRRPSAPRRRGVATVEGAVMQISLPAASSSGISASKLWLQCCGMSAVLCLGPRVQHGRDWAVCFAAKSCNSCAADCSIVADSLNHELWCMVHCQVSAGPRKGNM